MHTVAELALDPIAADRSRALLAVENSSTLKAFAVLEMLVTGG